MKKEFKEKWIEALRSGDYVQGQFTLKRTSDDDVNSFCCLDVLCDIVDPNGWELNQDSFYMFVYNNGEKSGNFLPDSLSKDLGISLDFNTILTAMNDHDRKSFSEIADYIEKNI